MRCAPDASPRGCRVGRGPDRDVARAIRPAGVSDGDWSEPRLTLRLEPDRAPSLGLALHLGGSDEGVSLPEARLSGRHAGEGAGAGGRKEESLMAKGGKGKTTSAKVASKASKVLSDGRYSKTSKSVAGSALAQAKGK